VRPGPRGSAPFREHGTVPGRCGSAIAWGRGRAPPEPTSAPRARGSQDRAA